MNIVEAKTIEDAKAYEIEKAANFRVLFPPNVSNKWNLEVKSPYPLDTTITIEKVRFHYFDENDKYVIGIEEAKADNLTKEEIIINAKTKKEQRLVKKYEPKCIRENIDINGYKGCFEAWANRPNGGLLWWIQDGTYIEMDSHSLTKTEMFKIAESMK
jgi:hypothetical protein